MLNTFYDKFIFTGGLKYAHNNFYLMNLPFLIMPLELLSGLAARQDQHLDLEIYYCSKYSTLSGLLKQFDLDFGLHDEKALQVVEEFFTASGWGLIEHLDRDDANKRAIVVVKDSPIAHALHGKVKFPVDHFLRGVFAGLFSQVFKADMECVESKCLALNEESCHFVVKQANEFDFSKKEVRRQLRVD
ncbi:MAG: 4-vinyl reductase [Candidatus Diapherotrites archaeon]